VDWPTDTLAKKEDKGKGLNVCFTIIFYVLSVCKYFNILNLTQKSMINAILKYLMLSAFHTNCKVIKGNLLLEL
jgi:hypothetical protein